MFLLLLVYLEALLLASNAVLNTESEDASSQILPRTGESDILSRLVSSDTKAMEGKLGNMASADSMKIPIPSIVESLKPMPKKIPVTKPIPILIPKPVVKPVPIKPHAPIMIPKPVVKPVPIKPHAPVVKMKLAKKILPLKKFLAKDKIAKLAVPKLKTLPLLSKPSVTYLKPIVHVVHKPVPVFHKVPVPKKVLIPKFIPVPKVIPVPKIIPVPYKVPVVKTIPKLVKIPKPIPVPKFIPVKKIIPIGIPVPVPKFHKFPVLKPVPYLKPIHIPIPKPVKKFVPVPIKKIIKVPKPFYVPVKIPHVTMSYIKSPVVLPVPKYGKGMPHLKAGFSGMGMLGSKIGGHQGMGMLGSKIGGLQGMGMSPHFMQPVAGTEPFGSGKSAFGSLPFQSQQLLQALPALSQLGSALGNNPLLQAMSSHLDESSLDGQGLDMSFLHPDEGQ